MPTNMLQKLFIQNYAIINEISIDFSSGLNIITGETGAGKSILMGALSLILGQRAESNILMDKAKKCVVEGYFKAKDNKQVKFFLKSHELDVEEELVVRREIAVNGKSRAFINDTPVNLNQLKELSNLLVDLHQQFDSFELGDDDFQREVIDALADNANLLPDYRRIFNAYTKTKKELALLVLEQQTENAAFDYNQFLFDELEAAGFKENELEGLDAEIKLLSNAENIKQQLGAIYFELTESELPIVQQLRSLANKLHSLQPYHPAIDDLNKRLRSAQAELQDIGDELETIDKGINYDAERIQVINDKISLGYRLLKKHSVNSTNELLSIKEGLQQKLDQLLNISEAIVEKNKEVQELLQRCEQLAGLISINRRKTVNPFTEKVNSLLTQVGMPNARLKVQVAATALNINGGDEIEFLF
ncbi:MAG: AAA family ATPase, partial [Ferruginibacter sp.]